MPESGDRALADGFAGERLSVLPEPVRRWARTEPVLGDLLVTDCGYFPAARRHVRNRPEGARETIVIVCAKGRGWVRIDGRKYRASAGSVVAIPPGRPHSYGADENDPWTIWWLHLEGKMVGEFLGSPALSHTTPVIAQGDVGSPISLIRRILDAHARDHTWGGLASASGRAANLLGQLAAGEVGRGGDVNPVSFLSDYLIDHPSEQLGLAEMAALVSMSPSHLATVFRAATGMTPTRYQIAQRMGRAREMLDLTALPVQKIAGQLGYQDPLYFTRQFTKEHGMSPTAYRAQNKG